MKLTKRILSMLLAVILVVGLMPVHGHAAEADTALNASLAKAKSYIDGITINNSSNDPATVVKNFKTHFTWDNEKRENSKSYLFDWSYYNGVVFEGIEYVYEVTGESVYKDYVVEYMSSLITASGGWATCSNNTSKQCAGYNSTHGADCYKTASLLLDAYEMTGDNRYLTMAATLYADLDSAASSYSLKNAGNNFRHTWASDPSPDLWLDGLYMILPFRAEYAKYIGDQEELDLIVSRMQWVSDNMYNSSKGLFYHAADSASSNSGTYWLRSIGWYAAAIVDIMDSMEGENLEAMKAQLKKLVDGMKACQNSSNGMWLNNMNASQSSSNPYETSGTALTCYAVMKAVNNGWLDESYADMAILAFNGICNEKLSGSTLKDICFKGAPGSSNSTFYDNEGKGVGPFIMFYAEMLEYVHKPEEEPEETVPETTVPEETEPEDDTLTYSGTGVLAVYEESLGSAVTSISSGTSYYLVNTKANKTLTNTVNGTRLVMSGTQNLQNVNRWYITQASGSSYYVQFGGPDGGYLTVGNDSAALSSTPSTLTLTYDSTNKCWDIGSGNYHLNDYRAEHNYASGYTSGSSSDNGSRWALYPVVHAAQDTQVVFTVTASADLVIPGTPLTLEGTVTVGGQSVAQSSCEILWSSSDDSIATVSDGTVSGVAGGNATITASLCAVDGTELESPIVLTIPVTVQGHNYQAVVTAPTCTEAGYTTYTCVLCGDSYIADETAALGHSYESVTLEPTCTENGSITYTCHCGDRCVEVLAAKGHDYKGTVTAPTCTESGYTTYTCACGHSYIADELPALGHTYTAVTTAPTCENAGYTTYTCACGHSYIADEVAALGHSYESVTVEPTCTENGSITYTCHCGDSCVEVLAAKGHDYKGTVTAPTCTEVGYTTYTCACGHSYTADQVAALGHTYNAVTVAPTCTEDGSVTYTCHCGDSYVEVLEALGHSYEAVITAPTCTESGYTTYTCACGDSYIADEVDALGHTYEAVTVAPTCNEAGSITYTCTCGDSYVEVLEALGHSYEAVITAPTCTESGYTTYTCACGHSYIADEVAPLGHSYEAVITAPTCTESGCTTYACVCGDSYTTDEVPALGHAYVSVTVEPTCTEAGRTMHTCARCADHYEDAYVAALGHEIESVTTSPTCETEGFTTHTCSRCGSQSVDSIVSALGHSYESVTVAPTCTEAGSITYTCHCGDSYVEVLEALGHSYEAVITAPTCTESGYTTYTCACGDSYISDEVAPLGHTYEAVTVAPTCTEAGSVTYTCHCGERYVEVLEALGHSYEAIVTAPTCTESGYTTYTCACGDSYTTGEVPALGHTYTAVTTAPTCVNEGYTTYTCACGDSYTADEVPALGHTYEAVTVAPTCTEDGSVTYTCHCGERYVEVLKALGHDYKSVTTAPTCTESGCTTHTCAVCGDRYSDSITAATGHSYTCVEENGFLIYTCGSCGDSYTESVAWIALPRVYELDTDGIEIGAAHKYLVVGANQNYALTVSGTTVGSAAVTVNNNTITLDDASNYEFYFVDNSSKESGSYLLTKDGSKYVYHMGGNMYYGTDNKGYWHFASSSNGSYQLYDYDNLNWYLNYGYVWGSDSVSRFAVSSTARYVRLFKATDSYARLSGEGFQSYAHDAGATVDTILNKLTIQLSEDGTNKSSEIAVTADLVTWDRSFEGFTAGTYTGTITYQGVVLGSIRVTITGEHTYETVTTEATCVSVGATTHTCTACGHSYQENVTAALGHSYSCIEENGYYVYTCQRCGDSYTEKAISYTQVSSLTSGRSHVITLYSGGKYYALSHANNSISVTEITVSDGEITSEITADLLWNYSGSKMSYVSGGTTYYLYCYTNSWWGGWWGNMGTSLQLSTTNSSTVSFSSNKLKVGSYYLKYSNGAVNLNSSATTAYVFVEN